MSIPLLPEPETGLFPILPALFPLLDGPAHLTRLTGPPAAHPPYVVDAHCFPSPDGDDSLYAALPASFPKPPIHHVVQVKMEVSAGPAPSVYGVKPFSIHPTVLNLTLVTPPSITNIAKGAVDIIVPSTKPMSVREWDLLEEAVNALDGSWGAPENIKGGGKIVISGILPPPLTVESEYLASDPGYALHLERLAVLSLHRNVFLKVLPPVVESESSESKSNTWHNDRTELKRVFKMYLSPAIETFGFHRIVFGSSPALPHSHLIRRTRQSVALLYPCIPSEWYALLREVLVELGVELEALTQMMGSNAVTVYSLDK